MGIRRPQHEKGTRLEREGRLRVIFPDSLQHICAVSRIKPLSRHLRRQQAAAGRPRPPAATALPTVVAALLSSSSQQMSSREPHFHSSYVSHSNVSLTLPTGPRLSEGLHTCFLRAGQGCDDKRGTQQAQARCTAVSSSHRGTQITWCPTRGLHSPPRYGPMSTSSRPLGKYHPSLEHSAATSAFVHGGDWAPLFSALPHAQGPLTPPRSG